MEASSSSSSSSAAGAHATNDQALQPYVVAHALMHAKSAPTLSRLHNAPAAESTLARPSIRKEAFQQKRAAVQAGRSRVLGKLSVQTAAQDAVRIALKPQQRVQYGDVTKDEEVGEGAFAVVFKGRWRGVEVAIKEIKYEEANESVVEVDASPPLLVTSD